MALANNINNNSDVTLDHNWEFDETAFELFQRCRVEPLSSSVLPIDTYIPQGLRPQTVVEIVGGPASGKTAILTHIIINTILPQKLNGVKLGGHESGVVYFDNDYHLDLILLARQLHYRIRQTLQLQHQMVDVEDSVVESCVCSSLQRLTVYRCRDTVQLLATLLQLPHFLSSNQHIRVLVMDSINAFFWIEKYEEQRARVTNKRINKQLQNLISEFHLVVLSSRQILLKQQQQNQQQHHHQQQQQQQQQNSDSNLIRDLYGSPWSDTNYCAFQVELLQNEDKNDNNNNSNDNSSSKQTEGTIRLIHQSSFLPSSNSSNRQTYKFVIDDSGIVFLPY